MNDKKTLEEIIQELGNFNVQQTYSEWVYCDGSEIKRPMYNTLRKVISRSREPKKCYE